MQELLDSNYSLGKYTNKAAVKNGVSVCVDILSQKKDNIALLKKLVDMEEDLQDLTDDMTDVLAFFKNQKNVFDSAVRLLNTLSDETEYLQAEQEATKSIAQIGMILDMPKPYRRISDLPNLMQTIHNVYGQLLDLKRQDVYSEIQAAMGEIHQTAVPNQNEIVKKADDALASKRHAVNDATSLTQLDAMKIQIGNIRQQYLKALIVVDKPNIDTVTINRSSICYTAKLESAKDIDAYVAEIKAKLMEMLDGHDILHII